MCPSDSNINAQIQKSPKPHRKSIWCTNPDKVESERKKKYLRGAQPGDIWSYQCWSRSKMKFLLEGRNRKVVVIYVREKGREDPPEMWRGGKIQRLRRGGKQGWLSKQSETKSQGSTWSKGSGWRRTLEGWRCVSSGERAAYENKE